MGKKLRLLFIGNSHTYYNDMPLMAAKKARAAGYDCEVTMIAHGGWFLAQHVAEPDVRFDILFGNYDYVILQEHAHPFGPEEKFFEAAEIERLDSGSKQYACHLHDLGDEGRGSGAAPYDESASGNCRRN